MASGKHVLLAPFMAMGHLIPFVELARRLSKQGHSISILTPLGQLADARSRNILRPEDEAVFKFIDVLVPKPPAVSSDQPQAQINVFAMLDRILNSHIPIYQTAIADIHQKSREKQKKVDVVIIDYYLSPTATTCQDLGIPYLVLHTGAPLMALSLLTIKQDTAADEQCTTWPTLRDFADKSPVPALLKTMTLARKPILAKPAGLILNSFPGLADQLIQAVSSDPLLTKVPVFQIGPLFQDNTDTGATEDSLSRQVGRWLDKQAPRSVIYVSFGTVIPPNAAQLQQMAQALLSVGKPFIWSLQTPFQAHVADILSAGMGSKLKDDSPLMVLAWSPQRQILEHPATGIFVSHCGWNSTSEALAAGKPILAWPMFSDQYLNAHWLQEQGIGLVVKGTGTQPERQVPNQEIADLIQNVMTQASFATAANQWPPKIAAAATSRTQLTALTNILTRL